MTKNFERSELNVVTLLRDKEGTFYLPNYREQDKDLENTIEFIARQAPAKILELEPLEIKVKGVRIK